MDSESIDGKAHEELLHHFSTEQIILRTRESLAIWEQVVTSVTTPESSADIDPTDQ